jgi:hypothetical protein
VKWRQALKKGLLLLASPILFLAAIVVKLLIWPFERPVQRTSKDVADFLEQRLSNEPDWSAWDNFTCIPIADKQLDAVRRECVVLEEQAVPSHEPPFLGAAEVARYRELVAELRGA